MTAKARFLYIFPSNFEHAGIAVKVNGQLETLRKQYQTTLVFLPYSRSDSVFKRLFASVVFEMKAFFFSFSASKIYIRYNPKSPLSHVWCAFLSFFKPVYIEHNTLLENELIFLGRRCENRVHCFLMFVLKFSRIRHIAVNEELRRHLCGRFGIKEALSLTIQNGFLMPQPKPERVDTQMISSLLSKRKQNQKVGIFCGNGYPWHGLDLILSLFKNQPGAFLIVVGPYSAVDLPDNAVLAGKLSSESLYALYDHCDFAVSTFRWDMLGIHEGSPLKTREYLCFGLPILVNYYDCAEDFDALKPYVYNYQDSRTVIDRLLTETHDKDMLKNKARQCLSWETLWKGTLLN